MKIMIRNVHAGRTEDEHYIGQVELSVEGHQRPYEIFFHSKDGRDWGYSLRFLDESGPEEEIDAVDRYLEENDEAFDMLLDTVIDAYDEV